MAGDGRRGGAGSAEGGDPERARVRGGRVLSVFAPGAPQLLAGRVTSGVPVLVLWSALAWLAATHGPAIRAATRGGFAEILAVAAMASTAVLLWGWSLRDVGKRARVGDLRSPWAEAFRAFRGNRVAVVGLWTIAVLVLIALVTPILAPFDPNLQGDLLTQRLRGPSRDHLLGTDQYARDVLSRILWGARISLSIGILAAAISIGIGTAVGAVAGFVGGWLDSATMRFVDMVIAFPRLILLIAVIALFQPSITLIVVVLGLTQWPQAARIVRSEVLSLRERDFVEAGRALGFSRPRLVLRHVLPNAMAPVIVAATLAVGDTIILEAGLSFLGLGIQPPDPSWGTMVADGRSHLLGAWWLATFPGFAIVLAVLSFNLAGDGLRDALDPRLRR